MGPKSVLLSLPVFHAEICNPQMSAETTSTLARALKGTADEYASRLLNIFPELAEIEHGEIEKTFRRMRGKEEVEP